MSDVRKLEINAEQALWDHLSDLRDVLLGAEGGGSHLQPMAPQVDPVNKTVWFYTSKTTDLAAAALASPKAKLCSISNDRDFHASIDGTLSVHHDPAKIEQFWSPVVAAWFPEGKEDPDLTLLAFKPASAGLWTSTDSAVKFGWEIAKANITGQTPDVGVHTTVEW